MRRYGSVWLLCSVRVLEELTCWEETPVCHVFGGTLVIGLITEPLGFVQDA